ncbi:hypothetical protein JG688_00015969, partial [Phytophthora aleatoria]
DTLLLLWLVRAGILVIKKLRELAIFFNSPLRLAKLKKVEELYGLPAINTAIGAKPRVGYAVTLMRRSVYNHYAFTQYFKTAPASEKDVWLNITSDDWRLIIEMKAITDQLAQFSLGEVQKEGVASFDADALARAEQELQLEHDAVFMALKSREIISEQCKGTDLDPLQILEVEQHRPSNALSRLLDVEVPTSSGDVRTAHDNLLLQSISA